MSAARMPRRAAAVVAMLALGLASGTASAALVLPDRPQGRVSDYARALDGASRQRLEGQIAQATQGRTLQYAVAIFPSLEGEAIEDVSIRLAERWKIGGKQDSDGVLLTVFLADRKLRIEVGYGLEGKLTDVQSARIIREVMAPRLRAGDLAGGLEAGIAAINEAVGGNPITGSTARPLAHTGPRAKKVPGWLLLLVLGGIIFIVWIVPWNPRPRRGGWPGGWSGGSGGFGGFGGGGGGGGGGFSGGGGSFGGGGASGGW